MSLNYLSLANVDALKVILETYDLPRYYDQHAEKVSKRLLGGLKSIRHEHVDRLHRGLPLRGLRTELTIDPQGYIGEGDLFVFASVLNEFFALYASLNSYHELRVRSTQGEVYQWTPRRAAGHRPAARVPSAPERRGTVRPAGVPGQSEPGLSGQRRRSRRVLRRPRADACTPAFQPDRPVRRQLAAAGVLQRGDGPILGAAVRPDRAGWGAHSRGPRTELEAPVALPGPAEPACPLGGIDRGGAALLLQACAAGHRAVHRTSRGHPAGAVQSPGARQQPAGRGRGAGRAGPMNMITVDLQQLIQALDADTRRDLERCAERCVARGGSRILVEDLLLELLDRPEGLLERALHDADVAPGELRATLQVQLEHSASRNPVFAPELVQWLQDALLVANLELGSSQVEQAALILALLRNPVRYA
uniref:PSD1 domain-containing protein n=1 Tax=Steinernema glaseri TaxID=37863 RepID=A0A1I8AP85_9BILA